MYLRAAERIARVYPNARFPIAFLKPAHLEMMQPNIRAAKVDALAHVGHTAEIIHASDICMSKSGSVSLELLFHAKPSTILYQVSRTDYGIYRLFRATGIMSDTYITLVNILAGRELFPEFISSTDVSEQLSARVLNWLSDSGAYNETVSQLIELRAGVAEPGATSRTAAYILDALGNQNTARRAA
jgi:lipid-A-disaccharide synthase